MTPFDRFLEVLVGAIPRLTVWLLFKLMILLGLLIYLAFAGIIIRQTALMIRTLNGNFATSVRVVAWAHLAAAAAIFLAALFIL